MIFKRFYYIRGENGPFTIMPEEAETVRRIYRRYLDGCSLKEIRQELEADHIPATYSSKWSTQTLRNILSNEKYIGDALLQKTYITDCISKTVKKNQGERPMIYVENHHQAIIPKEMFYRVQEEMARRASKRKVMQKTGKTEQGKYSAKYALSSILLCGECGTPYKRCTWARNGKKRIVWRCVSRLEFGTKYCHHSPSVDEDRLHTAIVKAMNEMAQTQREVQDTVLEFSKAALTGQEDGSPSLMELQERLAELTAEQSVLLDRVLENMDDPELNRQLRFLTEKKESLQEQIRNVQTNRQKQAAQKSRLEELQRFLQEIPDGFTEYEDELVRRLIETITVVNADLIRIRFRNMEIELEQQM